MQAMELNRAREWEQAAQVAQEWLDRSGTAALAVERCEALYHLAYANTQLGRSEPAAAILHRFDAECGTVPEKHWLRREVAKLRAGGDGAPAQEDGFWQVADGAAMGMDGGALAEHQALCGQTGADACLVVHRGKIVQEWYGERYRVPIYAMSSTKSITSLLVGMLVDEGKLRGVEEPVCTYISQWCQGVRGKVRIGHLLSMTSGLPTMREGSVGTVGEKNPYVIGLTPSREPGTAWAYSNEGVQLLSPILDSAAGEPIQDYARRRLFEPLGMRQTRLNLDQAGHAWTYADMETTPRDLARIGLLMLQKGIWGGQRIISEAWIEAATSRSQELNDRYGLLWWLYDEPEGFAALGYLDTNLYIFPKLDLVVVRMQQKPFAGSREGSYEPRALPLFEAMAPSK